MTPMTFQFRLQRWSRRWECPKWDGVGALIAVFRSACWPTKSHPGKSWPRICCQVFLICFGVSNWKKHTFTSKFASSYILLWLFVVVCLFGWLVCLLLGCCIEKKICGFTFRTLAVFQVQRFRSLGKRLPRSAAGVLSKRRVERRTSFTGVWVGLKGQVVCLVIWFCLYELVINVGLWSF